MGDRANGFGTGVGAGQAVIQSLLGDTDTESFLADFWERKHLFVGAKAKSKLDSLLPESTVNALLSRNDVRYPSVSMVQDGRSRPLSGYSWPIRIGSYSAEGLIDPDRVCRGYDDGQTIILQLLQNSSEALAEFTITLSAFFRCRVDVHAFLTPPHARGLTAHYDTASAFLIQVRGSKRWRLYAMHTEAPLPDQRPANEKPVEGEPIDDLVLKTGDVLYLPRGLPHEGIALEEESWHLTVVLFPNTWIDLLRSSLRRCQVEQEDFRRAPSEFVLEGADLSNCLETLSKLGSGIEFANPDTHPSSETPPVSPGRRRGRWL